MKMIVVYDGERYETKEDTEQTALEASKAIYEIVGDMNKVRLDLKDGSFLVLGKEAVQRAHFIFKP